MSFSFSLEGTKPLKVEVLATPVRVDSGNYTRVKVMVRGQQVIDHIPDMYPGDELELKLRFL